jgi:hypothetical protein
VQEKNPKGEVHEDEGFISFDRTRQKLVLRQFHVEGFVNQYVEEADSAPTRLVFTTESIENIPAGWRARETYVVHGPDDFEEIFELAGSGKPFELYSRARLTRVRQGREPIRSGFGSAAMHSSVTSATPPPIRLTRWRQTRALPAGARP